jgi:hypothetical protein
MPFELSTSGLAGFVWDLAEMVLSLWWVWKSVRQAVQPTCPFKKKMLLVAATFLWMVFKLFMVEHIGKKLSPPPCCKYPEE